MYAPETVLTENVNKEYYKYLVRQKALKLTAGNVTDYDVILTDILKNNEKFMIRKIAYDSWNASFFVVKAEIKKRVNSLAENNPMLGHRGCRLGITFPEITAMQTRAILGAACELKKEGYNPCPEIMVPLIGTVQELKQQKAIILATSKEVAWAVLQTSQ